MNNRFSLNLKPHLPLVVILLIALAFWLALFAKTFRTLSSPDQLDYAQIARHLLRGEGFITDIIQPLYLTRFTDLENHPEFLRAPGFSVLVALSQAIFGQRDEASVIVSGLAFVGTAGLTYLLSKELFQSETLAVFTGLLAIVNQELVQNSQNGLADLTFAFYLTLLAFALVKLWPSWSLGLLIGLGYLLRYNFLFMLPGVLLFWGWHRGPGWLSRKEAAILIGTFLITVAPWLWRNLTLAGSPTFIWTSYNYVMGTATYPGQELYRQIIPIDILQFILSHPAEMISKAVSSTRTLYNNLLILTNFFVCALFTVSIFSPNSKPIAARQLQLSMLVMVVCQVIGILALDHEKIRLFIPFIPIMIVLAAQFFYSLLTQLNPSRRILLGSLALALGWVAVPTLPEFTGLTYRADFEVAPANLRASEVIDHPDALIISDAANQAAWHLDRTAVGLPKSESDFRIIESLTTKPIYVFVFYTGEYDRYDRAEEYRTQYFENPDFLERYELIQSFETGAVLYRQRQP